MTLGKNIKKQQLIPDESQGVKATINPEHIEASDGTKKDIEADTNSIDGQDLAGDALEALRARGNIHVIIMQLGDGKYGFDIDSIQEVVFTPKMSEMPNAPDFVAGVASVREETMMFLDLGRKFDLQSDVTGDKKGSYSIIVESDHYIVGILSDNMPTTMVVKGQSIEGLEGSYAENSLDESFVEGLVKVNGSVVFLVDINALIESDKVSAIADELFNDSDSE